MPTQPTDAQRRAAQDLLSRMAGRRTGGGTEQICSGSAESPREQLMQWDVSGRGAWQSRDSLFTLEIDGRSRQRRESQVRTTYLKLSDALYFFQSTQSARSNRNLELPGNAVEGLFLDGQNLAFKIRVRSWNAGTRTNIFRTELRLLTLDRGSLTYSELFFHRNLLTGSRVWTLR